jgi:hypothetical protein
MEAQCCGAVFVDPAWQRLMRVTFSIAHKLEACAVEYNTTLEAEPVVLSQCRKDVVRI